MLLFAKQDINEKNLKVRAGHMLPSRFQGSSFTHRQLIDNLGKESIVAIDPMTKGFVVVEEEKLVALESENAVLRSENEQLKASMKALKREKKES